MDLDKAWRISKAIFTLVSLIIIPLFVFLISNSFNLKQIEISRDKFLAEIIPKLGSKDITERKPIATSLAVFQKHAISPLMALLNPNVLTEILAYPAISKKTASLGLFTPKTGYNLLTLCLAADISKRDEQRSDSTIDEYTPDELLPPEDRYRILVIPFKYRSSKEKLPSGRYLDEVLYKELGRALRENDRFSYVDLEENELIEIKAELDNKERFQIKAVKEVIEKSLQDHVIDGILIGSIIRREDQLKEVKACLHDLEDYRPEILTVTYQNKIKSDEDVYPFADNLIKRIQSKFPLKAGKVIKVKRNYFVCDFEATDPPLRKNMKLMIFEPDHTRLNTQGKIYRVFPKRVQARYCTRDEGEELEVGYIVITK